MPLTTFGTGVGNFFGGSLSSLFGEGGSIALNATGNLYKTTLPFADDLGLFGETFLSFRVPGLPGHRHRHRGAVLPQPHAGRPQPARRGREPGHGRRRGHQRDQVQVRSARLCIGGGIAGLGGLYFIMDYTGGTWTNGGFGDRGWLAIALVIFALWKPKYSILGSILFGGLYIVYLYIPGLSRSSQEIFKMLPYVVTIVVLVVLSIRNRRENQPPESLGLSYFREER